MSGIKWLQKQEHFEWMQKCLTCWKMCEEFIAWSIENGKNVSIINPCRDVSEMCSQCIKFEAQRSPFFRQLCDVCAEICENCALELDKYKNENEIGLETLTTCRIFASACREIAEKQKNSLVNSEVSSYNSNSEKSENFT